MISLLVISDVHASANDLEEDTAVSWYSTLPQYDRPFRNPFHGIPDLLNREQLSVDLILCPGDLADCAEPTAQDKAWSALENLRVKIGARRLVGTVGNHDVDSRAKYSPFDPKSTLQSLTPIFPGLTEAECDFFWARNFVVFHEGNVRFVVLNSAAFHGVHSGEPDNLHKEYLHGRVSDKTIEAILTKLKDGAFKLNILLLHHHIYRNEHITASDYSEMMNGHGLLHQLMNLLNEPWLVVHGHQHYPDLFYARGHAVTPVVLSAGSISRRLTGALSQRALNQIYHVQLPISEYAALGWSPCGLIKSWHWTDKIGWSRTPFAKDVPVPFGAGFGCRKHPDVWADEIKAEFARDRVSRMDWSVVVQRLPALQYVLPANLRSVIEILRDRHGIKTLKDDDGYPAEIGQ
jgi:hypothetical protein